MECLTTLETSLNAVELLYLTSSCFGTMSVKFFILKKPLCKIEDIWDHLRADLNRKVRMKLRVATDRARPNTGD